MTAAGELAFTPDVARATRDLYAKIAHVVPEIEWPTFAPYIKEIGRASCRERV